MCRAKVLVYRCSDPGTDVTLNRRLLISSIAQGVATFASAMDPNDTLNAWSNDISELLGKVEKMCHLIHKENMVHGIRK